MLSVQNIKDKNFEKAIFGGYDAKGVSEYMEEVASEFSILYKENMALKQKIKEVSDKNEEYKSVENSMRKALVSAQGIAAEMVESAEKECDKILKEASEIAHEQINTYRRQINQEQETLKKIQDKTSKFVSQATAFYEKQIKEFVEFSKEIPEVKKPIIEKKDFEDFTLNLSTENFEEINSIKDTEESVTENILAKIKSETLNAKTIGDKKETNYSDLDTYMDEPVGQDDYSKDLSNSSKFNFSELKFGKDYDGE